jgi:hypothetical protein
MQNRVHIQVEAANDALLTALQREVSADIVVDSFIYVHGASLTELPEPKVRGDLPLLTSNTRWDYGGMAALGRFTLHWNADQRCVYLRDPSGEPVVPLLPNGFAAFADPLRLEDYDGNAVMLEGREQNFGGGYVELTAVAPLDAEPQRARQCGTQFFIGEPTP